MKSGTERGGGGMGCVEWGAWGVAWTDGRGTAAVEFNDRELQNFKNSSPRKVSFIVNFKCCCYHQRAKPGKPTLADQNGRLGHEFMSS